MSVVAKVESLLRTLDLDEVGETRAEMARTLAAKLDQVKGEESAASAMAMAGINKELREVIDQIQEASDDAQEFVGGLFAPVGDSANT